MTVSLSIKNVPDALARAVRERASRNHRSLQGELMALLMSAAHSSAEAADQPPAAYAVEARRRPAKTAGTAAPGAPGAPGVLTLQQLWTRGKRRGLATPSESARFVREDRDRR